MKKVQPKEGESANIVSENLERLKELFPEAFNEGGIDFDVLRQLLGDAKTLDEGKEKYGLNWHGKKKARQIALTPSTGTLLPCPEESVDWDTTQNVFIEGDNLEVLKLLQRSYSNKVKMIYIDPPYNTGKEFIYPDKFQDNLDTYLKYTGQSDGNGTKFSSNTETNGRKHTNWLNMMYPRLKLARNLLSRDGILVTHIDEHELLNFAMLVDELFGPENNLGLVIWDKGNPKGDTTKIATQHEYIILYAKNIEYLNKNFQIKRNKPNAEKMIRKAKSLFHNSKDLALINTNYQEWLKKQTLSGGEAAYRYIDQEGNVYRPVSMAWPNKKQAPKEYFVPLIHPVTRKECPVPERGWRNPPRTMQELLKNGLIVFGENEQKQPERKYYLHENMVENIPSILQFAGSDDALLKELMIPFYNPKPVNFVKQIIQYFSSNDDIVMDFFAGSATTSHAVMKLNSEGNGNRKFIVVQLPENCDQDTEAFKAGYKNVSNIAKKRIYRVSRILQENLEKLNNKAKISLSIIEGADLGFKVFKLSSSNINAWNPDRSDLEETLLVHQEHLIEGRSEQDILYELLLKRGIDLAVPVESRQAAGKAIYSIGHGALFACLDESITSDQVEEIAQAVVEWYRELAPEDTHVFFRDSAFTDDVAKTNMAVILEQNGITHVRSL